MSFIENNVNYGKGDAVLDIVREHVALLLLIDNSGSMCDYIGEVNRCINQFIDELNDDDKHRDVIDLCIMTFNTNIKVVQDFKPISQSRHVNITANGSTDMGTGILKSIQKVKERLKIYQEKATAVKKPWIFMVTDGYPNSDSPIEAAKQKLQEEYAKNEGKGKLLFWAAGVDGADFTLLRSLVTDDYKAYKLKDKKFADLFDWITKSMVTISSANIIDGNATLPETPKTMIQIPL